MKRLIRRSANKHCELDPLPTHIVKECLGTLLPIITEIINVSLQNGIFIDPLNHALIRPLLKKLGLALEEKNYRPVSNLSFISKLIEAAVVEQYNTHLYENDLHDKKQSAYKKQHSTETLLLRIQNDIMVHIENGEIVILVLLDLSAAFDTIDHDILLQRLEKMYGIGGMVLKWFAAYLKNRTQSVVIGSEKSDKTKLNYGVPQGSKLGPLLFTSYIAPLSRVVEKNGVQDEKYADDGQLWLAFRIKPRENQFDAKHQMENCIKDVRDFLLKNKLCNNEEKTEFLLLGSQQQLNKVEFNTLKVGDVDVKVVDKARNLGVIFDKNMTMQDHVSRVSSTCYFNIKRISSVRRNISKDHAKDLTNAFVTSHLDYGNSLLYGIHKKQIDRLQLVQNAAARVIDKKLKYDHITQTRKDLHWLPVIARPEFKILTFTWQALHNTAPGYLTNLIQERSQTTYNVRNNNRTLLSVPSRKKHTKTGDRAFQNAAPKLWNQLPQDIQESETLNIFKKKLKTHFFKLHYDP